MSARTKRTDAQVDEIIVDLMTDLVRRIEGERHQRRIEDLRMDMSAESAIHLAQAERVAEQEVDALLARVMAGAT